MRTEEKIKIRIECVTGLTELIANTGQNSVDVHQILISEGEDFVIKMYESLLRRSPDPIGFKNNFSALLNGVPKEVIFHRFISNQEFIETNTMLTNYSKPILLDKLLFKLSYVKPLFIVYKIIRYIYDFIAIPRTLRQIRITNATSIQSLKVMISEQHYEINFAILQLSRKLDEIDRKRSASKKI